MRLSGHIAGAIPTYKRGLAQVNCIGAAAANPKLQVFYPVFYLTKSSLTIRMQFTFISYSILYLNGPANLTEV